MKLRFHRGGSKKGKGSYYITIPKRLVEILSWKKDMDFEIRIITINGKPALAIIPKE